MVTLLEDSGVGLLLFALHVVVDFGVCGSSLFSAAGGAASGLPGCLSGLVLLVPGFITAELVSAGASPDGD
jgi:hypothetical protein